MLPVPSLTAMMGGRGASLEETASFEKRCEEASRMQAKYPDRTLVICGRAPRSSLPEIGKKKWIVPNTMLFGEFVYIIHKHLSETTSLAADQTIYLFVSNGSSPKTSALMSELHESYRGEDGFLYVSYSAENTLGEEA
eukprot:gnl/TRDRNA2_/TRDRNA2_81007_c0_seq1.p1 gnl/TRDRNA2_/TRDRNA2_81007_c0~~gnl/TRDRNA2_/TRDRNA2_81007_c0_seq1.p1  ORF type:complete len:138 (-),score=15.29 gnl/TRDRNA2_/TRDRNA2_81007_c0_seq1:180-593(-)